VPNLHPNRKSLLLEYRDRSTPFVDQLGDIAGGTRGMNLHRNGGAVRLADKEVIEPVLMLPSM
jgi:hypothetical protein